MYDFILFNFLNFHILIYNLQLFYSIIIGSIIVYLIIIVNVVVLVVVVVVFVIVLEIVVRLRGVGDGVVAFLGGILIGRGCWGLFGVGVGVRRVLRNIGFLLNCLYY